MGRLILSERGRILMQHHEELTRWRLARKRLTVPRAALDAPATLWLLLGCYPENDTPLHVRVNGSDVGTIEPITDEGVGVWCWRALELEPGVLREGQNEIVLHAEPLAMNAWMLALDPSARRRQSALSVDGGRRWHSRELGAHGALSGEYLIRLRSHSEQIDEHRLPRVVYEDPRHDHVRELLSLLPESIVSERDPWQQVLALRTWVARQWTHHPGGDVYTPWDAATILDWARRERGHGRRGAVAMCVHFGVTFTALASALGHRARCIAITGSMHQRSGHFIAEVYDRDSACWVAHDANFDVHYAEASGPLAAPDLAERAMHGADCSALVLRGPGFPDDVPRLVRAFETNFGSGRSYRHVGVWTRNDFTTRPAVAPPSHGANAYCETDFVWYAPDQTTRQQIAMFPYQSSARRWFDRPPRKERGTTGAAADAGSKS